MKKHSKLNRLWIAISITVVTLIIVITYLYDTNSLGLLWRFEWKSFSEIEQKLLGSAIGVILLSWFSSFVYEHIFPKNNPKYEAEVLKRLKSLEENAAKQGITKTEEELIKENEALREKLKKESVVSIGTKLQTKLDKLFSEFRYEEFRNTIDDIINQSNQKDLAKLHFQKALAYEAEINYSKAKEELETAVALDRTNPEILHQYAFILNKIGEYDKAIDFYEKALKIDLKVFGDEHPDTAVDYNNIGSAWDSKGKYDKAIDFYEKALKINLKVFGDEHPAVATCYNNLGSAWKSKCEYDKAIDFYQKALKIKLKVFDNENHPSFATSYNNIGSAWDSKGEYDKAIDYYEKTLKILRKVHPNGHPYINITEESLKLAKQARNK